MSLLNESSNLYNSNLPNNSEEIKTEENKCGLLSSKIHEQMTPPNVIKIRTGGFSCIFIVDNFKKSGKKQIRFLRTLYAEKDDNPSKKEMKSRQKRWELSLKIFELVKAKNKKYTDDPKNYTLPDQCNIFSKDNNLPSSNENFLAIKELYNLKPFDPLELLRPQMEVLQEFCTDPPPARFNKKSDLRKVSIDDHKSWIKNMMWSPSDLQCDYRNEIHTIKAGWVPTSNQRTWNQFLTNGIHNQEASSPRTILYRNMASSLCILAKSDNDPLNIDPKQWFSLFPLPCEHSKNEWMDKVMLTSSDTFAKIDEKIHPDPYSFIDEYVEKEIEIKERKEVRNNYAQNIYSRSKSYPHLVFSPNKLFQISADEYYIPRCTGDGKEDNYVIQIKHSLPALDLQRTLFPTYLDILQLRRFHRPLLSDFDHGSGMKIGFHVIHNLKRYIDECMQHFKEILEASGSQGVFLMKSIKDLSCMNGHLILLEYLEEFPPLLSQIGMNSLLRVYLNKVPSNKQPNSEYGDLVEVIPNNSPFLGLIKPGESVAALENNMFRAPLFKHSLKSTDFLVIRNSHGYFIRSIPVIFCVGQLHPKIEVPGPNSKAAMRCARERLQTYIFRMLIKSNETPKRLKIATIRRAFKQHSENSIRKRLKICAQYSRQNGGGGRSNWWVLRDDFRLPTHEDMHQRLQPETICAYYSMLVAQRRLKDAGYGKKSLFMAEDENDDDVATTKTLDEEILCAPWHTTRAFLLAQRGKCLLAINGFADPTGCGEGFSFVRHNYKSVREEINKSLLAEFGNRRSKTITGTDADLRKLRVGQCRHLLKELGIPNEKLDKMQRWDMINLIRSIGSVSSKAGNLQDTLGKFARSSRFSNFDGIDKYRDECQAIFDLQTRCLSSTQDVSSDEEDLSDVSDLDELTKNLELMLNNKKETTFENFDEEENARLDLMRLLDTDTLLEELDQRPEQEAVSVSENKVTRLSIHRTFKEGESVFVRTEEVNDPRIIAAYLRITKNPNYRQVYARYDNKTMEELRKEKKRVMDQLRRIRRNEERGEKFEKTLDVPEKKNKTKLSVKCTACGDVGHMRTNKICPRYIETRQPKCFDKSSDSDASVKIKDPEPITTDNILKVEGTRLVVGKALVEAADELTKANLLLKMPKDFSGKKRKKGDDFYCELPSKQPRGIFRRRTDPAISLNAIFEEIITKLKEIPESILFHQPVCIKKVPDYLTIIKQPMDFQTMKEKSKTLLYKHRDDFIADMKQIHSNSIIYNGLDHPITQSAKLILDKCQEYIDERNQCIFSIEKEINPLLGDDPQIKMSHLFEDIITNAKTLAVAVPFIYPVNTKLVRDYYTYVQKPMDLETIRNQCITNHYQNRERFFNDVDLILKNCIKYNGENHQITNMAHELHGHIMKKVEKNDLLFSQLEDQLGTKTAPHVFQSPNKPSLTSDHAGSGSNLDFPSQDIETEDDFFEHEDLLNELDISQDNSDEEC